jgi:hypothetical protein
MTEADGVDDESAAFEPDGRSRLRARAFYRIALPFQTAERFHLGGKALLGRDQWRFRA